MELNKTDKLKEKPTIITNINDIFLFDKSEISVNNNTNKNNSIINTPTNNIAKPKYSLLSPNFNLTPINNNINSKVKQMQCNGMFNYFSNNDNKDIFDSNIKYNNRDDLSEYARKSYISNIDCNFNHLSDLMDTDVKTQQPLSTFYLNNFNFADYNNKNNNYDFKGNFIHNNYITIINNYSNNSDKANDADDCMICKCENSNCLKMYCECLKKGGYCNSNCRCKNCKNTINNSELRELTLKKIKKKNPSLFKPRFDKVANFSNLHDFGNIEKDKMVHTKGCNCKKGCNKKYCECKNFGTYCTKLCKCKSCVNIKLTEKSVKKKLFI